MKKMLSVVLFALAAAVALAGCRDPWKHDDGWGHHHPDRHYPDRHYPDRDRPSHEGYRH